jgi:release factor glutamine methyltransferase
MDDLVDELRAAGSVFAEDEARLLSESAASPAELEAKVRRRTTGVPLQQIHGWAEVCGLRIRVEPGVFLPRPRSEFLVEKAIGLGRRDSVILDVCCGTGALGVASAIGLGSADLHATDIDPVAARCAAVNVDEVGGRVYQGDLFQPLPRSLRGRADLLLLNAPYVPTAELPLMPREARLYEETVTLDGGDDGLDIQRRAVLEAPLWMAPGAHLLVETSDIQAGSTMRLMKDVSLAVTLATSNEWGATVVIGRLPE